MFILILGLAIIAVVTCIIISSKTEPNGYCEFSVHGLFFVLSWAFGVIAFAMVVTICCLTPKVATASTIDEKIEMLQEENAIIEQEIDRIVEEYLKHEQDTFTNLKTEDSSITLVTLFPELKSDTLVQQQLEIYLANNAKIKGLREERIDIAKLKWILYFGK